MAEVKHFKFYSNSSKDDNWYTWEEDLGGKDDEAGRTFSYCGYEICFHCMVDMDTGIVEAYGVEDRGKLVEFERPVKLS